MQKRLQRRLLRMLMACPSESKTEKIFDYQSHSFRRGEQGSIPDPSIAPQRPMLTGYDLVARIHYRPGNSALTRFKNQQITAANDSRSFTNKYWTTEYYAGHDKREFPLVRLSLRY
jgi:hypothetical protein